MNNRMFCNKIWNGFKLTQMIFGEGFVPQAKIEDFKTYPAAERWVISKYEECVKNMNKHLENHKYADTTEEFSNFWFYSFCDYYLEYAKFTASKCPESAPAIKETLLFVIKGALKLLHPIMPFLTE